MSDQVIGTLEFDYLKSPYTYTNVLDSQYSEYRGVVDIYAKGTTDVIGKLNIFTTITLDGSDVYGEVEHLYSLPEGIIRAIYVNKNTMNAQGGFKANNTFTTAVNSGSSENFLGSVGVLEIKTDLTQLRSVKIVFDKAWIYPLKDKHLHKYINFLYIYFYKKI